MRFFLFFKTEVCPPPPQVAGFHTRALWQSFAVHSGECTSVPRSITHFASYGVWAADINCP